MTQQPICACGSEEFRRSKDGVQFTCSACGFNYIWLSHELAVKHNYPVEELQITRTIDGVTDYWFKLGWDRSSKQQTSGW